MLKSDISVKTPHKTVTREAKSGIRTRKWAQDPPRWAQHLASGLKKCASGLKTRFMSFLVISDQFQVYFRRGSRSRGPDSQVAVPTMAICPEVGSAAGQMGSRSANNGRFGHSRSISVVAAGEVGSRSGAGSRSGRWAQDLARWAQGRSFLAVSGHFCLIQVYFRRETGNVGSRPGGGLTIDHMPVPATTYMALFVSKVGILWQNSLF